VFADPQAIARNLTVPLEHPAGLLNLVASPLRLAKTPPEYRSAPPTLGQHTDEVLRDALGISDVELEGLRDVQVIA
jgi:crotonobetainyl-CoA:carnitine CoA-transferase CaiB-like acyl-CoA transferase